MIEMCSDGPARRVTVAASRRSYEARLAAARRLVESGSGALQGRAPSDAWHAEDVAFGVTRSGRYLDAKMVESEDGRPIKLGAISHSALLLAAGLSTSADDPHPIDDYVTRGIVKAGLGGCVIFWESGHELLRRYRSVRKAVDHLVARGIVRRDAEVYGCGERVPVAVVDEILQW
jgi:hypothetical protein